LSFNTSIAILAVGEIGADHGVDCQQTYNSINMCQKILFFILYIADVILIYGVKWIAPKTSCIHIICNF